MGKVVGGTSGISKGWLGSLKALLGLGSSSSPSGGNEDEDDEDEDEEALDYVDWAWAQRAAAAGSSSSASSGATGGATSAFSLDKLDEDVVSGGKASFVVASIGKERGWDVVEGEESGGLAGLKELKAWLSDPDL
jgi:hypothetical protein